MADAPEVDAAPEAEMSDGGDVSMSDAEAESTVIKKCFEEYVSTLPSRACVKTPLLASARLGFRKE